MNAAGSSQRHRQEQRAYRALCCRCTCNCRLRFSSSDETESFGSERFPSDSSISHAMDQMIRQKQRIEETKFVVMVAMEKCSDDPKEDFRVSMMEMILGNGTEKPKDLRSLLNCYISMNNDECHGVILEVFHEVCCNLFLGYGTKI
ncbi:probable transcription repressor OFP9 [Cucurbita pepo subsp. pepo]|uniref:probable transcription repressor OFP9 n=1 Tax=Cucurbita pepo subsp. pepo TaxID=3664 RepID=UPI000C9D46B4|nr:probable transcription repressor OFP9 [Cucurbita pepo subsp. pepo]